MYMNEKNEFLCNEEINYREENDKIRLQIEQLAVKLVDRLIKDELFIATAESCTGGMVASSIVDVPNASSCFNEGVISYSNEAKMKYLGVADVTLEKYGAVSKETVKEMADGIRRQSGCDISIVTSGVAGPTGGTEDKPVGLVYIACAFKEKIFVISHKYKGDRTRVRLLAVLDALKLCINTLDI
ncbi:MAG: CinA family protein [Lachnospiraceae bacterium]|nr:CinA family protein [Lachnospiraceae bacterium]